MEYERDEAPEPECSVLPGLGEKCDCCMSREAVLKVLNSRNEREIAVTCEECLDTFVPKIVDRDDRQWPF